MEQFTAAGKSVQFFPAENNFAPLVILHTVHGEGERVYRLAKSGTKTDFSFAAISNLNWDDEMSPWAIPPISKDDTPCTGGADAYLEKFTGIILPEILKRIPSEPRFIALTGYSLAGLFALYSAYKTNIFSRLACASGSFWYPGFSEFVERNEMQRRPDFIYFSLGDKEAKTRNKILQSVEQNTGRLKNFYEQKGIDTVFEMNEGNHFYRADERMAKGICRILNDV